MIKITIVELMEQNLLSVRSSNLLRRAGYVELGELENFTYKQIYFIRNCGQYSSEEIIKVIELVKSVSSKEELVRHIQITKLKQTAMDFLELNKKVNSRKVTLLLNLALDNACSFGELRNSIRMCGRILAV